VEISWRAETRTYLKKCKNKVKSRKTGSQDKFNLQTQHRKNSLSVLCLDAGVGDFTDCCKMQPDELAYLIEAI
jgi:hypothetical protein